LDLQCHIEDKAKALKNVNLQLQPLVVVLCSDVPSLIDDAVYYAVLQNRVYYECASLLEAVDVCLKASFVFNLQYSPAAHSVWLFLQKAVYGIQTPSDNNPVKVLALITDTKVL